jgi:hypothetical protein
MSPEVYTAAAVHQAIAQGAITEAYQADPRNDPTPQRSP